MNTKDNTAAVALCGVLTAASVAVLYLSTLSLFARWSLVALAGLFPVAGVMEHGRRGGLGIWAAAGSLGLILLPDRLNALLFLLLFGLYPVVKSLLEERSGKWLCLLGKLCFFNAVAAVFYWLFASLFLPAIPWDMEQHPHLIFLWGSIIFLAYDYGLTKLITFYLARIRRAAKGNRT